MAFKGATIKGVDTLKADFKKFLNETKTNPIILNDVGERTVNYIRGNVRSTGRPDQFYKMWRLEEKTQYIRKALAKSNETHSTFSPGRSNLTFTGQLLDSMKYRINTAKGTVTVYFEGIHQPYKRKDGSKVGEAKPNSEIAAKLNADERFHFLFLSDNLQTILQARILSGIRRQLSLYRKFKKILNK